LAGCSASVNVSGMLGSKALARRLDNGHAKEVVMTRSRTARRLESVGLMAGWLVLGTTTGACGSGAETKVCGPEGCEICDAYGCRPADPEAVGACDAMTVGCACTAQDTCASGLQCMDGMCLKACEFSSQCGAGRVCVNGKCIVGCDTTMPCEDGQVCSAKGVCEPDEANPGCGEANPCVGGLKCVQGVCQGGCKAATDCASGEICDGASGSCIPDPQPKAPCATDPGVCGTSKVCVNGYCRYPCTDSAGCVTIDARIPVCKEGVCWSEAEANPQCTQKSDCPAGQDCVSNVCK